MNKKQNSNSIAGTTADSSTPDEVTTSSQTIAKPLVVGSAAYRGMWFRRHKWTGDVSFGWVYGDFHLCYDGNLYHYITRLTEFDTSYVNVDSSTIGRNTGMLDEDGTPIYEGDLIETEMFNGEQYTALLEVVWDAPSFCLKMVKRNDAEEKDLRLLSFPTTKGINQIRKGRIIGNVHENKNLLPIKVLGTIVLKNEGDGLPF